MIINNDKEDLRQKSCHHKLASDGDPLVMMCGRDEEPLPSAITS